MRRRRLVARAHDRGGPNDFDRYDRQRDQAIRGSADRRRTAGCAEARALMRVAGRRRMVVATVHASHGGGHDAVVEGTGVRAERLGRREHKRETNKERAQPSPDHFNRKTNTWGLRLVEKDPLDVPNTIVTVLDPAGVAI